MFFDRATQCEYILCEYAQFSTEQTIILLRIEIQNVSILHALTQA